MKQIGILLSVGLSLAVARLGWVWLVRHDAHVHMEAASQARRGPPAQSLLDDGGTGVKITQFYARSGEMTAGDSNLVCYGVSNATSVRRDPPVEDLYPARNRCFFVEPQQDITYTLVAEGADGSRATESFRVLVKPAPPEILMLATSERRIPRGEAVTICYGVAHASKVRIEPAGWQLPPLAKSCTRFYPSVTGKYTLIATGEGGTDRQAFSVTVQ